MASPPNNNNENELLVEIAPIIKVYKNGKVERLIEDPDVPPSPEDLITKVSSKDITIFPNQVSARLFLPKLNHTQKIPILVFFHGGGFCFKSAFCESHHRYLNTLVSESNVLAVSVEYRLAPEHPLPIAYENCWTALKWVVSHFNDQREDPWLSKYGDFGRIFLGGDSAGATIVHNMVMKCGVEGLHGGVKILGAFLGFPYFWGSKPIGSMTIQENEESVPYRIWELVYPNAPGGIDNPMINPFGDDAPSLVNLGCAKVMVYTGEKDLLRDVARQYVEGLKKSGWGGEVEFVDVEGEDHCFQIDFPDANPEKTHGLIKQICSFMGK